MVGTAAQPYEEWMGQNVRRHFLKTLRQGNTLLSFFDVFIIPRRRGKCKGKSWRVLLRFRGADVRPGPAAAGRHRQPYVSLGLLAQELGGVAADPGRQGGGFPGGKRNGAVLLQVEPAGQTVGALGRVHGVDIQGVLPTVVGTAAQPARRRGS